MLLSVIISSVNVTNASVLVMHMKPFLHVTEWNP